MTNYPPLTVRIAFPADAPEIARLNRLFNGVNEPAENYARRMRDERRVDTLLLAEIDGRAAGFASLRLLPQVCYSEPYAELTELFVEEGFRRRGAGRALIAHAEELAREGGAPEMVILTGFDNHAARALYCRLGYRHQDLALNKSLKEQE